jgi:uncharacterized protein (DUF305 family)
MKEEAMFQQFSIGILVIALASLPIIAQSQDAAEQAFMVVKMKMRETMPVEYTGDPDSEFMRSMIPHNQGAIGMAEVELKYGTNPQARALAEKIIEAKKTEIELLNAWLKQRGQ